MWLQVIGLSAAAAAAYVLLGLAAAFWLWPRGRDAAPATAEDHRLLLRMAGLWPRYVFWELAGITVEWLGRLVAWRMRGRKR